MVKNVKVAHPLLVEAIPYAKVKTDKIDTITITITCATEYQHIFLFFRNAIVTCGSNHVVLLVGARAA